MARKIPPATVNRLPVYLRALLDLSRRGITVASSETIATESQINAAQIRKDLSLIGAPGTRGIGYDVQGLLAEINDEMGLHGEYGVALVGYGKLGAALVGYQGFNERGYRIRAIFDSDPSIIGSKVGEIEVEGLTKMGVLLAARSIEIAVIATPAESAQKAASELVKGGILSILNFAPVALELPEGVAVRNVDMSIELQLLSFHNYSRQATDGL